MEMREAAQDKAFDILDEIKDLGHKKNAALCELEDTLYECFESSKEDYRGDEEDFYDDDDIHYRKRGGYRYNRHYAMRDEDEMDRRMHMRRNRQMRMRGRRMN